MTNSTARGPVQAWDVVLSILFMIAAFGMLLISAFFDVFALAFTDYCPASCEAHLGTGVAVVFTVWIVSAVVAVAGTVITIVRLVRRRRGWWVALLALVLVMAGTIAALWLYAATIAY